MAEINKRNLVDETAKVYAANTLANEPTPLFSTGMPAKIIRASIANTNLLSKDGDLFVGTGDTYTETIDGTEYTYAKIAKKNQSKLFVDGLNSTATNVGLAASVGKFIDDRLHISNSTAEGTGSIALGYETKTTNDQAIAIGYMAEAVGGSVAIGKSATASAENTIQLGLGTNSTTNSFQVGNHQMLDLNTGKMPIERINATGTPNSLVIGGSSSGADCVAYGFNSDAGGMGSVAIGYGASVLFDGGIAIGKNANTTEESGTAIQLGTGTNSTGGFQVWDYQLLTAGGIIVRDRLPTLYKHRLKKNVVTSGSSSGALYDTYICEWYSNKRGLPTTQFNVMGHIVKWNTQQPTSTDDSLADFEFKDNNLVVKYLGSGNIIATFAYNDIEESLDVQEI